MRTALQEAYVFDTTTDVAAYQRAALAQIAASPVVYVSGYSEATRNPHWACNRANPNCAVHRRKRARTRLEWLADKMDLIGAITIGIVLVIIPGVLPIFV